MRTIIEGREFLKANFLDLDAISTDQQKKINPPLLEKPVEDFISEIQLPAIDFSKFSQKSLTEAFKQRRSHRKFTKHPLQLEELSYLLWATQGVKETFQRKGRTVASFRTVPSAGARHPFETYLLIFRIDSLEQGIYKYSAIENKLFLLQKKSNLGSEIVEATLGQSFTAKSAVVFVWSCIPYRAEWRYDIAAHKGILLDAGHVGQNLYLACETIGAGTCAIAAYNQKKIDKLLKLDGKDEFVVYLSPVGKTK